jgi:hypothetical protein
MKIETVEVPELPLGPLTPKLEAEAKRRLEEVGLEYGGTYSPDHPGEGRDD